MHAHGYHICGLAMCASSSPAIQMPVKDAAIGTSNIVHAGQCSDAAGNVASACGEFEGAVDSNSGAGGGNSSISDAIDSSGTTISSG